MGIFLAFSCLQERVHVASGAEIFETNEGVLLK